MFPCYGEITREEVISQHLDYYSLKTKADTEKAKVEAEEKKAREEREEQQQKLNRERSEKVGNFLKAVYQDFGVRITSKNSYDDNLYKTHRDHVNAFINSVDLAIKYRPGFAWRKGHTSLGVAISGGPDTNITKRNVFIKGKGQFDVDLRHTRGKYALEYYFGLGKDYTALSDIKTNAVAPDSLIDYWKRSYGASFHIGWKYFPTNIRYSHTDSLYERRYVESNTSGDTISLGTSYSIFPKTSLLSSLDYSVDNAPKRPGARLVGYTFWGGVRGKLSSKLEGTARAGYRYNNPKEQIKTSSEAFDASLDYKMTKRLTHNIGVKRSIDTTEYNPETWVKTTNFSFTSDYLPPFSDRLRLGSSLLFINYGYGSERKENFYQLGLKAEYSFKNKLKVATRYDFNYRNSDQEEQDYKANMVSLEITKEF